MFIKSHRLYGHLNGTTTVLPEWVMREVKNATGQVQETVAEVNLEYETWMAHYQSLVAYISSTLSEEVLTGVDDDLSMLELWNVLATMYFQVSEARFLQLKRQFQDIKRRTRSVLEYIHEIKNVSDQLAIIGHPVSDKDKVQQALSGLGSKFDVFCTALEVLSVLPSFEDLKEKLIQHEASRVEGQELVHSGNHNVLVTGAHAFHGNRPRVWNSQSQRVWEIFGGREVPVLIFPLLATAAAAAATATECYSQGSRLSGWLHSRPTGETKKNVWVKRSGCDRQSGGGGAAMVGGRAAVVVRVSGGRLLPPSPSASPFPLCIV
ncbi:hypothetical protein EJ110_NYTH55729 [Nymphaea thermarum]|nr:hypothetical protein EJ110_NYTH55729 [Nymphaea thermarum]